MDNQYLELSIGQVAIASTLILACALVSFWMKLQLGQTLLWAGVRTVLQLTLLGFVLEWIFATDRWYWVFGLSAVMTTIAGNAATDRARFSYPGIIIDSLISIWASSWIVTAICIFLILQVRPWYLPQFVVPMLGLILGNSLTGISLGLDRLLEELSGHRDQVDSALALGATRWEAARGALVAALRVGMIPIINMMKVVGIVSIPGIMTGQLLGGVSPPQAVKYQIVVMFVISAASTFGTLLVVLLAYRRLFNSRHQFLHSKIVRQGA